MNTTPRYIKKIYGQHGARPEETAGDLDYQAAHDTGGHKEMGFSVIFLDLSERAVFYHDITGLTYRVDHATGKEYISFTYNRTEVYTIAGFGGLRNIYARIIDHTLQEIHERTPRHKIRHNQPVVENILVNHLNE